MWLWKITWLCLLVSLQIYDSEPQAGPSVLLYNHTMVPQPIHSSTCLENSHLFFFLKPPTSPLVSLWANNLVSHSIKIMKAIREDFPRSPSHIYSLTYIFVILCGLQSWYYVPTETTLTWTFYLLILTFIYWTASYQMPINCELLL